MDDGGGGEGVVAVVVGVDGAGHPEIHPFADLIAVLGQIDRAGLGGQQVGLHPVATLVSMFLGTKLLGIVGLFGFPITLVILKQLNDTGKIKLYK